MGSSRLPGKVLETLGNDVVLGWTVRAARMIPGVTDVIVATSDRPNDANIEEWCASAGASCFRGSEHDVLDRYVRAAKAAEAEVVLRLTADCPLLDPAVCGAVLMLRERLDVDYASNIHPRFWPDGLDCEVLTLRTLKDMHERTDDPYHREHVTTFLRSGEGTYSTAHLTCPIPGLDTQRWTLDDATDLAFVRSIVERLPSANPPSYIEVLRAIERPPALRPIGVSPTKIDIAGPQSEWSRQRYRNSQTFLSKAEKVIPLGTQTFSKSHQNLPEGFAPLFLTHGRGARTWDIDGNEYVDLVCGLLSITLGHCDPDVDAAIQRQLARGTTLSLATDLEYQVAEKLSRIVPCAEKVRFGKNGTDATSACIRLARAATGRTEVIACGYHGWQDWYVGATTRNKGVPHVTGRSTHMTPYGDVNALEAVIGRIGSEVAALILEPTLHRTHEATVQYLRRARELTERHGIVLVFDEVITGFRYATGGSQSLFGVHPDLAAFGKGMGNGMPISAVLGKSSIMDEMNEVFLSSTFGGETLSLAAASAVIEKMEREPVIERLWQSGQTVIDYAKETFRKHGVDDIVKVAGLAPWSQYTFQDYGTIDKAVLKTVFVGELLASGVLLTGSNNICFAHSADDLAVVGRGLDAASARLRRAVDTADTTSILPCPPIRPIFKVRAN